MEIGLGELRGKVGGGVRKLKPEVEEEGMNGVGEFHLGSSGEDEQGGGDFLEFGRCRRWKGEGRWCG